MSIPIINKKLAVITYFHTEPSICLAKAFADKGIATDFYILKNCRTNDTVSGINYTNVSNRYGIVELSPDNCPEIYEYIGEKPMRVYFINYTKYSRVWWLTKIINRIIIHRVSGKIKIQNYYSVNLIGQHGISAVNVLSYLHNELKECNLIHTLHEVGDHLTGTIETKYIRKLVKDNSKVSLPSQSTYDRYLQVKGVNPDRVRNIPIGLMQTLLLYMHDFPLNIQVDNDKTTFLFYGRFTPYKGMGVLADACRMMSDSLDSFNLIVAGGGEDENLEYFKTLPNCHVINHYLANDEMMKLNQISDVVLLPYLSASQSGIVLTSFLLNVPVIATKVGALKEVIVDRKNGLLIDSQSPEQLVEAMKLLMSDKTLLSQLKSGASEFGHGDIYDWNNIAAETLRLMEL